LIDVVFNRNRASLEGGGYYSPSGNATLINSVFNSNSVSSSDSIGGGGLYLSSSNPILKNVTSNANSASSTNRTGNRGGGGLYLSSSSPTLTNVTFTATVATSGFSGVGSGGGLYLLDSSPTLTNVTFAGNTGFNGDGIHMYNSSPTPTNVTFSGNTVASSNGGGINVDSGSTGSPTLTNAVIWGNYQGVNMSEVNGSGATFSRSNVRGCGGSTSWDTNCGTDDGNNIDTAASPFTSFRAPSGSWTTDPFYSGSTVQTTFNNSSALWSPDELVGLFIQPDVNDSRWLPIVSNTGTTLFVWGDWTAEVSNGAMYYIHSLRLVTGSDCIDSGDNTALPEDTHDLDNDGNTSEPLPLDLDGNPRVVNDTVDMGAYEYQGG
jgi:hypothetical protein